MLVLNLNFLSKTEIVEVEADTMVSELIEKIE